MLTTRDLYPVVALIVNRFRQPANHFRALLVVIPYEEMIQIGGMPTGRLLSSLPKFIPC